MYLGLNIEWRTTELTGKGRENTVSLTHATMEMIKPLLLSQPYIAGVESFEEVYPEKYRAWVQAFSQDNSYEHAGRWYSANPDNPVDLDKVNLFPVGAPYGNIFRWPFFIWPDMACDLSTPWIEVPKVPFLKDTILINRTLRCQNESISYAFLKEYQDRLIFVGLDSEFDAFQLHSKIFTIQHFKATDFLQLATWINSCKVFIGNQSLCFSLAEALKVPRILETCDYLPNVIPQGKDGYDFIFQWNLEWFTNHLANGLL